MRIKVVLPMALVACLLLVTVSADAASVRKMSLPELTRNSEAIVIGTVTEVSSSWATDRAQIFTSVTLNVSESLKGNKSGVITFTQIGGVVGDTRVSVAGFPKFVEGSEVLLFLANDPDGYIPTIGLGQGKFDILTDQQTGEKTVANDVLGLQTPSGRPLSTAETTRMTLDEMKTSVTRMLSAEDDVR
ncbi:MAG: hypothetical protein KAT58_04175 [candidate division Zixibacteria bacterium]|nr:hypothetical protein [candidate division Zixibacteria bacterium]